MALSTEQLLLLNNIMYAHSNSDASGFSSQNAAEGMTVGEYVATMQNITDGDYTSAAEWTAIRDAVRDDSTLSNLQLVSVYGGDPNNESAACNTGDVYNSDDLGGRAAMFVDPSTNEAIVVFQGTGGGEWPDNFEGGSVVSTSQQDAALSWYQSLGLDAGGYDSVTVTGHSKGGNKAKFITLLDDSVSRCVSFDGQGFSDDFIAENADNIQQNGGKIENHNVDYDYVNILMNDVGNTTYYQGNVGDGDFLANHAPSAFFGLDGALTVTDQPQAMKDLDSFLNSYLRSMPAEDRAAALSTLGDLAGLALGDGSHSATLEDYMKLLSNPETVDQGAHLLAFLIQYEREVGISGALSDVLTQMNLGHLIDIVDKVSWVLNNDLFLAAILAVGGKLDDLPDWMYKAIAKILGVDDPALIALLLSLIARTADCYPVIDHIPSGRDRTSTPRRVPAFIGRLGPLLDLIALFNKKNLLIVKPHELREAATKLERALQEYIAATDVAQLSARDLSAQWEGAAQKVFVIEQENAFFWYFGIAEIGMQYVAFLRTTADEFEEADLAAKRSIMRR